LTVVSMSNSHWTTQGVSRYYPSTRVNFSTTVRDPKGTGSGWAGVDDYDIARVDMRAVGQRALEKCLMSRNPVALEPGRYTTILEPQAVADLWRTLLLEPMRRSSNEDASLAQVQPFYRSPNQSKIGEHILDERLTFSSDPMDPIGGFVPFLWDSAYVPTKWIDRGYLRELWYDYFYGLVQLGKEHGLVMPFSWRLSGGTTTKEEMIATTKRGLLVTRLHNLAPSDGKSATCTGYTRDGLWLIEDGKISKPVKNFRFTESPLFVFNKIEQLGPSERVFSGPYDFDNALIAPTLKVNDFNFTQLADAV
jgi:predicted Zn-dependent protease